MSEHEQWDIVTSIGLTALIVAAGRSVDTYRDDGLIEDPFAEAFVKAANPPRPIATRPVPPQDDSEDETWQMMSGYMGVRTRYFDEQLLAGDRAGITQFVVLAAGLDARAFRLDWSPGAVVYEVDQPAVLDFKDAVLADQGAQARCDRRAVRADLRDDWVSALSRAGLDPQRPIMWLAEGLLPYLPAAAEQGLLEAVDRLSVAGSRIEIENFSNLTDQLNDAAFRRIASALGVDMQRLLSPEKRSEPGEWLGRHGWQVATANPLDLAATWGRTFDTLTLRLNARSVFIEGRRAEHTPLT